MLPSAKAHLGEMDYFRAFGLTSIVIIHSMAFFFSLPDANIVSHAFQGLTVNLFRYGRFVFMFITGLVFFYSYQDRKLDPQRFYRRRLKNLIIPYAVWTAVYLALDYWSGTIQWSDPVSFVAVWAQSLVNGNAFYHLYYIIVTIQFYLFLPLLLVIFKPRRPRLWAGLLMASGFLICMVYFYGLEAQSTRIVSLVAGTPWAGVTAWLLMYKDHLLFSYLPFYLLGGLAGIYLEECHRWLADHIGWIEMGLLLSAALVIGQYFYCYRYLGQSWDLTVSVFKPSFYLYSLFAIAILFRLSLVMMSSGSLQTLIKMLSSKSLGIYLMHPAVLFFLHNYFYLWSQALPSYILVIIDPFIALTISYLITRFLSGNNYTRFVVGEAGK